MDGKRQQELQNLSRTDFPIPENNSHIVLLSPLICCLEGVTCPLPNLTPVVNSIALFCVIAGILGRGRCYLGTGRYSLGAP